MDPTPSSGVDSPELADSLLFSDEIQSLSFGSPPVTGSSFTALLGLGPNQAVELLHDPEPPQPPLVPSSAAAAADEEAATWQFPLPPGCTPTFPSNRALVDRAARFSVFAAEDSPEEFKLKAEPSDSGDWAAVPKLPAKRKEVREKKTKGSSAKKTKSGEENCTGGDDKLPYVHVRARRGQATDSHSLAERARREKINARMKLLQELVPGCNKISGTALVLDEIINHVQSLQRQVEFLSMRLAAVNPTGIDFTGILSSECARLMAGSPWLVADGTTDGDRQQQIWQDDMVQQQQQWGGEDADSPQQQNHVFMGQQVSSLFPNYGSTNSVSLSGQLKTEL